MSFFTDANLGRARDIVAQYPRPKSAILPLAHLAQDQHGWLPPEAIEQIAELTGVTAADALGTCSFYTMLKRRPCGKLLVSVCTNVTCLVTGGPEVLEYLEEHYAADPDITIEEVECLAACGGAPALQVNYEFHERVSPASAEEIVDEYKSGARPARTISGAAAHA
ncbi:MAG TPA: NAD(P)H-dependent oxidoreductase subunit E [Acidimicrobiia bacterium]|nr:NAD(P)H-dependent oxidoreductase subunit E [Acidimicrobiia bacterium]